MSSLKNTALRLVAPVLALVLPQADTVRPVPVQKC